MISHAAAGHKGTRTKRGLMRRLIMQMGVSIDGFVAALDGSHPWGYEREDPATKRWKLDSVQAAGAHLMGRVTYQDMAAVWPTSTSEYAAPLNEIPKVVFSKTLEDAGWAETRIPSGGLREENAAIKPQEGNDVISHGGGTFAQALSRLGLGDESPLNIQPAALG